MVKGALAVSGAVGAIPVAAALLASSPALAGFAAIGIAMGLSSGIVGIVGGATAYGTSGNKTIAETLSTKKNLDFTTSISGGPLALLTETYAVLAGTSESDQAEMVKSASRADTLTGVGTKAVKEGLEEAARVGSHHGIGRGLGVGVKGLGAETAKDLLLDWIDRMEEKSDRERAGLPLNDQFLR